ncbi:MAG: hypothetical protein J6M53_04720 [Bacteroidaceae bacterium]|nr:hypothetical protein [Bacteroidaceae bacterium]
MKRTLTFLLALSLPLLGIRAQGEADCLAQLADTAPTTPVRAPVATVLVRDAFTPASSLWGWGLGGYDAWTLHEGVNARFSFGAAAGFGRRSPHGVGLSERVDFAYAGKYKKRLSWVVMVTANNTTWGPLRHRGASVTAAANYQLSDAFSIYAYVTKSLLTHQSGGYIGLWGEPSVDRVGVVADWTPSESFSLQIAVEAARVRWNGFEPFCHVRERFGAYAPFGYGVW